MTNEPDHIRTILLNRIPEVTLAFWVIKVLSTTTGETAANFLNVTVGLGLQLTTLITGVLLVVALVAQFLTKRYTAPRLLDGSSCSSASSARSSRHLTDGLGFPLWASTVIFTTLLAVTFGIWFARERTLSIHTIFTRRREAFYWARDLFTFALGTAAAT